MFNKQIKSFTWGRHQVRMETGEIARQATGAVLVDMDDTVVLATVVASKEPKAGQDFFPLTVDYIEKFYAAGRIPGGFFKREAKPSDHETLIARLIDRPIRPLFPEGFYNDVHIVVHLLSVNPDVSADIPAMIASSAALAISGIPFSGPLGAARVGLIDGQFVLNPSTTEIKGSKLDLVVAGTENAVLMVESAADELSEDVMLEAVNFGHEQAQVAINAIHDLVAVAGKPSWDWEPPTQDTALVAKVEQLASSSLQAAYKIREKQNRSQQIKSIYQEVIRAIQSDESTQSVDEGVIKDLLFALESKIVRTQILSGEPRIDGRDTRSVRPIAIRNGVLPRTHGSSLFTRGETQALVIATLGTKQDEQVIDSASGEYRDRFLLHYNMPPFATGEVGRIGSTKRREIGHGRLAKRALESVLPTEQEFPYTVRLVSEITESNGSSSMASVCGGCLALMDAGVPIKAHVAGVAMGLILEQNRFAVLTDILGDEDHLGDMDFKVAGTAAGITALQMDIKVQGITPQIMKVALYQALEGRLQILQKMQEAVADVRQDISEHAPRLVTIKIHPDKIRDVIGKGGTTIQAITRETGANVDIAEDGTVTIASTNAEGLEKAKSWIMDLTTDLIINQNYDGVVTRLLDFGAVVALPGGKEGLLHISEIVPERIRSLKDWVSEGQKLRVKVIKVDDRGKIGLSVKAVSAEEGTVFLPINPDVLEDQQ